MSYFGPFIARIIAGLVGTFAAWLSTRWGIVLDAETQGQLVTAINVQFFVIFSVVYPVLHKWINSKLNPSDAATKKLVREGKAKQEVLEHRVDVSR